MILSQYGWLPPLNAVLCVAVHNSLSVVIFVRNAVGPHEENLSLPNGKILLVPELVAVLGRAIEDLMFSLYRRKAELYFVVVVEQTWGTLTKGASGRASPPRTSGANTDTTQANTARN